MSWLKEKWQWLLGKILAEHNSPEFIARGWAVGMFYGCTIPFGFQLLLSLPTAQWVVKGSKVGATIGTFITNHFSIFLIYPFQCWLGNRLMGGDISYSGIVHAFGDVLHDQSWEALLQISGELLEAFFLGGFVLAAVMVPLTYWGVLKFVRRHRRLCEIKKGK